MHSLVSFTPFYRFKRRFFNKVSYRKLHLQPSYDLRSAAQTPSGSSSTATYDVYPPFNYGFTPSHGFCGVLIFIHFRSHTSTIIHYLCRSGDVCNTCRVCRFFLIIAHTSSSEEHIPLPNEGKPIAPGGICMYVCDCPACGLPT